MRCYGEQKHRFSVMFLVTAELNDSDRTQALLSLRCVAEGMGLVVRDGGQFVQ